MLDPAIELLIRLGFALLFITAGMHKGSAKKFGPVLEAYKILPSGVVPFAAFLIPIFEIWLSFAWAVYWIPQFVPLLTAGVLASYALAMGINIKRGRSYIDCGCGFSSSSVNAINNGSSQPLSIGLIVRNTVLVCFALIALLPTTDRSLGIVDYSGIPFALIAMVLLYSAFNQLLINNSAINSWRNTGSKASG